MKLGIETSSRNCSVVLWDNQGRLFVREKSTYEFVHAEELHSMISDVMKEADIEGKAITSVVVGRGPGSYTGLRIGVSCAKGICFSLGVPLYSISSLTLMVLAQPELMECSQVLAVMDARRMEVFGAKYHFGKPLDLPGSMIFEDAAEISKFLDLEYVVGENASKLSSVLDKSTLFLDVLPSARTMALKTAETYFQLENLAYFEPEYVKPFIPTVAKK